MSRSGGLLTVLLIGLAVFAVVYLLFGESMTGGAAGTGFGDGEGRTFLDPLTAEAGLETGGRKPRSADDIAAEKAAAEKKAREFPKSEGFYGVVTDGKGSALEGATIKLLPDPPEDRFRRGMPDRDPIATTTSKADGSFLLGPAPEEGSFKVRGEARGFAATIQRVRRRGARVDLILDRGGALEVRVLSADGKALKAAQVLHQAGSVVSAAQSDDEGIARFSALPTGTGSLLVSKEGYAAVRDRNVAVAPDSKEERTLILPKGIEIAGTVTNASNERPVAGASVTVRYQNLHMLEPTGPVETGEDGRFRITAFASGNEQMIIRVAKEGFAEGRNWRNASAKGEVTIKLFETGEDFTGSVLTHDRQPVEGVTVTYGNMQQERAEDVPEAATDEDGNFTLARPAFATPGWRLSVIAVSEEHGIGFAQAKVPKKEEGRPKPVELQLSGSGGVKGVVKDAGGTPVQGALVSLGPDWNAGNNRPGRKRVPWQLMNIMNNGKHYNLTTVTGADGTYLIESVPAMEYKVTASFGLDQFTLPDAVTVEAEEVAEANIALGEGGTIEGWVLDSEEKPVAGAYVSANPVKRRGYNWWRNRPTARSQSDGRFVLRGVTDERYHVYASASGFGGGSEKNVSQGTTEITLRVKALGWIDGVVYTDGSPYRGTFKIVARPVKANNSNAPMRNWTPGMQTRTFNTDDGKFKIKGLKAGDYTVQGSTTDGLIAVQPDVVTVMDGRGSREARLDLQPGAVLRGTVRNDETGKPISNAWIYANPRAGTGGDNSTATSGNAQSDSKGKYEIKGLGTGAYTITVWSRQGSNFSQVVDLQQGNERQLDLVQLRPGMVQVTVTDEKDKPIEGARVNIRSSTGQYVSVNVRALQKDGIIGKTYRWQDLWNTGADGTLTRYHVPPGLHNVTVSRSGYTMAGEAASAEVGSGRVTPLTIKMKKKDGG